MMSTQGKGGYINIACKQTLVLMKQRFICFQHSQADLLLTSSKFTWPSSFNSTEPHRRALFMKDVAIMITKHISRWKQNRTYVSQPHLSNSMVLEWQKFSWCASCFATTSTGIRGTCYPATCTGVTRKHRSHCRRLRPTSGVTVTSSMTSHPKAPARPSRSCTLTAGH